jgi:hypothetical protein
VVDLIEAGAGCVADALLADEMNVKWSLWMRRISWLFFLTVGSAIIADAAESNAPEAARACAAQRDDAARLACYDAAFGVASSQPESPLQSAPAEPEPSAEERFGMRGDVARETLDRQEAQRPRIDELQARIVEIDWLPRGEFVVTLDNGQVWTQKRKESIGPLKVGDTVTIRAGAFGSFRMTATSTRATKVQRTK